MSRFDRMRAPAEPAPTAKQTTLQRTLTTALNELGPEAALVAICERDRVPFVPWETFDDVRGWLETAAALPGPVAPVRCPGWIPA
jgi:hypothetical protein